jgi:catechol 2,3-dioxygenase
MIRDIGHVALRVPDLDASIEHATQVMGLRVSERSSESAYLTHDQQHHSLQLLVGEPAFDHMSFSVGGESDLEVLKDRLDREGAQIISEVPEEPGLTSALRFVGPGGHVFEIYCGMADGEPGFTPTGVRPSQFGHVTIKSSDPKEMSSFAERMLGFVVSDTIEDAIIFMRCNPNHHAFAIAAGGVDQLHHYAWECESASEQARLGDSLFERGGSLIWGPGRHGPGNNIFTYHLDPVGAIVEYYADLTIVLDDSTYEPRTWPNVPPTHNYWGPMPNEDFLGMGLDIADPAKVKR